VDQFQVFKEQAAYDEVEDNLRSSTLAVLSMLSFSLRSLQVMTVELEHRFLYGVGEKNDTVLQDVLNILLRNNCKTLEMVLFHTDNYTNPWTLPDCRYDNLVHVNFAGDVPPGNDWVSQSPNIKFLKVTTTADGMREVLKRMVKYDTRVNEVTFRPISKEEAFLTIDLQPIHMLKGLVNFEWNCTYSGFVNEQQLELILEIPDMDMFKISTRAFTDSALKILQERNIRGLFIGRNSLGRTSLIKLIETMPNLLWLRTTEEYGPVMSKQDRRIIRMNCPGIKLWTRAANQSEETEQVVIWKNKL